MVVPSEQHGAGDGGRTEPVAYLVHGRVETIGTAPVERQCELYRGVVVEVSPFNASGGISRVVEQLPSQDEGPFEVGSIVIPAGTTLSASDRELLTALSGSLLRFEAPGLTEADAAHC